MASMIEAVVWKYGSVADMVDNKIIAWRHPTIKQPDEVQLISDYNEYILFQASVLYQKKRAEAYPPVGDQLDAMWKAITELQSAINVKPSADITVITDAVEAVKEEFPKPKKI